MERESILGEKTDVCNGECPFCGETGEFIFVHGHGQCRRCGLNILPCCEGVGFSDF